MKIWAAGWSGLRQRASGAVKVTLTAAFVVHVLAYHVLLAKLTYHEFQLLIDIAILLYMASIYILGHLVSGKFVRVFGSFLFWCALSSLVDTINGTENVYTIQEYIFALLTAGFVFYEYRKQDIGN
jgi:hypothetical protein